MDGAMRLRLLLCVSLLTLQAMPARGSPKRPKGNEVCG